MHIFDIINDLTCLLEYFKKEYDGCYPAALEYAIERLEKMANIRKEKDVQLPENTESRI